MRMYVFNARKAFKFMSIIMIMLIMLYVNALSSDFMEVYLSKESGKKLPIYCIETADKNIAITFDCAWGADDIPRILKVLSENNIKTTFFVVGQWAEKYPEAIKQMASEGHDIAMHGYTHTKMGQLNSEQIISEVLNTKQIINKLTGKDTDLLRVPYGDYSNKVMTETEKLGCYVIQWDVDSLDWKSNMTKQDIIERVLSKTKNGSILLFHNDTKHTASIIGEIIERLKQNGYNPVPVSQLIYKQNYYIDYNGKQHLNNKR